MVAAVEQKIEVAVFGGGCFWCTEAVFDELRGVLSVMPGYAGGVVKNPTYEQVCAGRTGHAEVIRIEFNFNDFRVARPPGAHLLVGWIFDAAAGIARHDGQHAAQFVEHRLRAPEAAPAENRDLSLLCHNL